MRTDPLLTTADVARWLNVSTRYVRKLAENGTIPYMRLHSGPKSVKPIYRFDGAEVAKALKIDPPVMVPTPEEIDREVKLAKANMEMRLKHLREQRKKAQRRRR